MLADVFGKKPEDQIAVLLKQGILTTILPAGVRVAQMLATVQFYGDVGKNLRVPETGSERGRFGFDG